MQQSKASGRVAAGLRQTLRAVSSGKARRVWVADDAAERIVKEVLEACEKNRVPVQRGVSMEKLGRMCRLSVPCAAAALTANGEESPT
ncbi:MAG: ribosomal L7Ae/L30e/S12e/Gadd45 family protein [Clostridia bacterium]|nr:ribosomal L7Ae/L30e/S12e/Gadd45 family protein [Clostridia bacterium]